MIRLGTCGFSYLDWVGRFYPSGTRNEEMLERYAQVFDTLELNVTFYANLSRKSVESLLQKAQGRILFSVKAPQALTHEKRLEAWPAFRESLAPFEEASHLGCILLQFPHAFQNAEPNRTYLAKLTETESRVGLVVEFRHRSWAKEEVFEWLKNLGLGWCCVDEPALQGLMPRSSRVTSSLAYLRFHGRNAANWWHPKEAWERYDYLYPEEELREWVPAVRAMEAQSQQTFVFFNNHYAGKAPQNALLFRSLLEAAGGSY